MPSTAIARSSDTTPTGEAAIEVTSDNLCREIDAGERERDKVLKDYGKLLAGYLGESSRRAQNQVHMYCSAMIPKIVFDNPRVNCTSQREAAANAIAQFKDRLGQAVVDGTLDYATAALMMQRVAQPGQTAMGLKHALNTWVVREKYQQTLGRGCFDMLTGFSVLKSSIIKDRSDPTRRWPVSRHVPPDRFSADPTANHITEAEWMCDWEIKSRYALAKQGPEAGWDMDAIDAIVGGTDASHDVDRNSLRVYECWVSSYREDDWPEQTNGGLFTLGCPVSDRDGLGKRGAFIRKPRPMYGPATGPWAVGGAYVRPKCVYPMSPLLATFRQGWELDLQAQAMSKAASKYKQVVLVSDANPKLAADLKSAPDNFVIQVNDAQFGKDKVVVVELAGITDQQLKHFEYFQREYNRAIGMDDQQRGEVDTDATAAAVTVADEATDMRVSYIARQFHEFTNWDLRNKAWYFVNDELIDFPLGVEASEDLGMIQPRFRGGPDHNNIDLERDLQIEIDHYSMGRTNQLMFQQNMLQAIEMIVAMAPTMVQITWLDYRAIVRKIGIAMNVPDLEDMVDFEMIQQMAQLALASGVVPGQEMSGDGAARKSEDEQAGETQGKIAVQDHKHGNDMEKERFKAKTRKQEITLKAKTASTGPRNKGASRGRR